MPMPLTSLRCARAVRDGGIDAMAALNEALQEAIAEAAPEHAEALKQAFGRAMANLSDAFVNPAVKAFPELEPDEATWAAVVKSRASARAGSA